MEEAAKAQAIYFLDGLKQRILRNEFECTAITEEEVRPEYGLYIHDGAYMHVAGLLPKRRFVIEYQPTEPPPRPDPLNQTPFQQTVNKAINGSL